MTRFTNILVIAFATISVVQVESFKIDSVVRSFGKVNDYLFKRLGSGAGDIKASEIILHEKLEKLKSMSNFKSSFMRDKHYEEALGKLLSLAKLGASEKCTDKSHELLEYSDKGTEGKARAKWNPETARPIDKLVHRLFVEHAQYCDKVYPIRFNEIYASVDKKIIAAIDPLLSEVIEKRLDQLSKEEMEKEDPVYLYENMVNPSKLSEDEALVILDDISKKSRADRAAKIPEKSFFSYIEVPCEQFQQALKSNLFGPASFDQVITKPSPKNGDELEYFNALTGYNTCTLINTANTQFQILELLNQRLKKRVPYMY